VELAKCVKGSGSNYLSGGRVVNLVLIFPSPAR
jgi:hypothetical protein